MRRTPLKRRTRLRARSTSNSYRLRERHIDHMLLVKKLPCVALGLETGKCRGPIEADHAGRRGTGQKCDDRETIPLCSYHHRCRHGFAGPFKGWVQEQMREWLAFHVRLTQQIVHAMQVRQP